MSNLPDERRGEMYRFLLIEGDGGIWEHFDSLAAAEVVDALAPMLAGWLAEERAEHYEDGYDQGHADAHADGAAKDDLCRYYQRGQRDLAAKVEALAEEYDERSRDTEDGERYPWGVAADDLRALLADALAGNGAEEPGNGAVAAEPRETVATDVRDAVGRREAIAALVSTWLQRDGEFCVGGDELDDSRRELHEHLRALGVSDAEMDA